MQPRYDRLEIIAGELDRRGADPSVQELAYWAAVGRRDPARVDILEGATVGLWAWGSAVAAVATALGVALLLRALLRLASRATQGR